jgi:hypothetical protein
MTTTTPDLSALQQAIETRDAAGVVAWYTDDAVITLVDRDHPPVNPTILTGTAEISAYYTDVCGRNINHRLDQLVVDATGLAYVQLCRYPDGVRVTCATVAELRGGRISRQTIVQAWDT